MKALSLFEAAAKALTEADEAVPPTERLTEITTGSVSFLNGVEPPLHWCRANEQLIIRERYDRRARLCRLRAAFARAAGSGALPHDRRDLIESVAARRAGRGAWNTSRERHRAARRADEARVVPAGRERETSLPACGARPRRVSRDRPAARSALPRDRDVSSGRRRERGAGAGRRGDEAAGAAAAHGHA